LYDNMETRGKQGFNGYRFALSSTAWLIVAMEWGGEIVAKRIWQESNKTKKTKSQKIQNRKSPRPKIEMERREKRDAERTHEERSWDQYYVGCVLYKECMVC